MKILFSFLVYLLFCISLSAQQFGGNPPSLKWQQINTPQVKVIFPVGLDTQAMEIASIAKTLAAQQPSSLGNKWRKVNLVLQNQTLQTNGYVGLGPYRSEFLLAPSPNSFELGNLPWHKTLAIHELRHVQQFSNFNKGWSKVFSVLFGEQGQDVANAIAVPNWFWEGDAVANETQVSNQGRGRLPYFFNGYASLFKENRKYSWLKLRNGSFRDFVPDHYKLGYLLVAYGRQKYGDDFWKNVTQDAVKYKGWLDIFHSSFQQAIKRYSEISYKEYRKNALSYFDSLNVNQRPISIQANEMIIQSVKQKHFQADYQYPYIIGKDSTLILKSSYHAIPAFYIVDKMGEHRIRAIDIHLDDYYSYRNGKIIYASYKPDIRWGWKNKTRIAIMDIKSEKQEYVTHAGRYFSPDMDETEKYIIVVALNNKGESILQYINISTKEIKTIPNAEHLFFTHPKFINQQNIVAAARTSNGKMTLVQVNLNNGMVDYLTPLTNKVIGFPCVTDQYIYFSASSKLSDEQFALNRNNKNIFQITQDGISSYEPNIKNGKMIRSVFTATGYHLLEQSLDSSSYKPVDSITWMNTNSDSIYSNITMHNQNVLNNTNGEKYSYSIKSYSKSTNLFNFHSWRPFYKNPEYSLTLYGENVLNTFTSELAYTYNQNEKSHKASYNFLYGAWFPYIQAGINYTFDRSGSYKKQLVQWNEAEANIGLAIPLNLTSGRNISFLNISSNYNLTKQNFKGVFKDSFDNRAFTYLNSTLSFFRQTQIAVQHIYPKFAQSLIFNVRNAITNRNGYQWLAAGSLYFPGLFKNHSISLEGAYQEHDQNGNLNFSNSFPFSRGYTVFNFEKMQKLSVNYHLPLLYPDFGIGGIVYFKRIRANLFYDYSNIIDSRLTQPLLFKSTGTEIYFDTKWWNEFPITIGFRYSHLLDQDLFGRNPNQWEVLWPTNLF